MGHTGQRLLSLEKMMGEGAAEGTTPWEAADPDDYVDPAAATDRKAALQTLHSAIGTLSQRDQTIMKLRYGRSMPFHEIDDLLNLSESRVCQLHKRILGSLQKRLTQDKEIAA